MCKGSRPNKTTASLLTHVTMARAQDTPHQLYPTVSGWGVWREMVARTGDNTQSNYSIKSKFLKRMHVFPMSGGAVVLNNAAYVPTSQTHQGLAPNPIIKYQNWIFQQHAIQPSKSQSSSQTSLTSSHPSV